MVDTVELNDQDHHSILCMMELGIISPSQGEFMLRHPEWSLEINERIGSAVEIGQQNRYTRELDRVYAKFRSTAPIGDKVKVSVAGVRSLGFGLKTYEYCVGSDLFVHHMDQGQPTKALKRIRSYKHFKRIAKSTGIHKLAVNTVNTVGDAIIDLTEAHKTLDEVRSELHEERLAAKSVKQSLDTLTTLSKERAQASKLRDRANKRAADNLRQYSPENVAYLDGETVSIKGCLFIWQFTPDFSKSFGHSSITTTLLDHEGVKLCNLCVYFKDTPAAEQLISMLLHIENDMELDIINKANVYNRATLKAPTLLDEIKPKGQFGLECIVPSREPEPWQEWDTLIRPEIDKYAGKFFQQYVADLMRSLRNRSPILQRGYVDIACDSLKFLI